MNQIDWLKHNARYLKIDRIERELKMAQGTLLKHLSGKRGLTGEWQSAVTKWIITFRKNPAP